MEIAINYWAVLVAAVASVVLGSLWYGPLFGKKWMELNGMSMPDPKPPVSAMVKPAIMSIIGTVFMSLVLARLISVGEAYLGFGGAANGLATAAMAWIGFVVPVNLNFTAWEGKPWALFAINTGYWLVLMLAVGAMLAVW
jgi:hypothetical protein